MCADNKKTQKKDKDACSDAGQMPSQSAGESKISYLDKPKQAKDKKIHSRQKLPAVPKGKQVPDKDSSPPLELD